MYVLPIRLAPLLLLAACAGNPGRPAIVATDPGDPYEATNRRILDFNLRVDDAVLKPVALGYRSVTHSWTRTRIRTALDNLSEPVTIGNNLLQGRPLAAGQSFLRLAINTTLGLGGTFDMAQFGGPPRQPRDFGQTLYTYGFGDGPYLMLPILGPSNVRDTVGLAGDSALDPLSYVIPFYASVGRGALSGVSLREQNIEALDELRGGSLDFYSRLRSVWRQRRDAQLNRRSSDTAGEGLDDPGTNAPSPALTPRR